MPTNYIGNEAATEAPSAAPATGTAPTLALPVDGDPANAASTYQPWKVVADFITFAQKKVQAVLLATRSLKAVYVDALGDVAVAPPAGSIRCTADITTTAGAANVFADIVTTSGDIILNGSGASGALRPVLNRGNGAGPAAGTFYRDQIPMAWGTFNSAGGTISEFNCAVVSHIVAGVYIIEIRWNTPGVTIIDFCASVTAVDAFGAGTALIGSWDYVDFERIKVIIKDQTGAYINNAFSVVLHGRTS
jgi:hypothetical protein